MSAAEEVDLNFSLQHAPHYTLKDALSELVMNSVDATSFVDATNVAPVLVFKQTASDKIILEDKGGGIEPKDFVLGGDTAQKTKEKVVGRFGMGLKDAVATLMRNNGRIEIESGHYTYTFVEKKGSLNCKTIHLKVMQKETRHDGTRIVIALPGRDTRQLIEDVKSNFLLFYPSRASFYKNNMVEVYEPLGETGELFVNGVKWKAPQSLHYSYNFHNPTQAQKDAANRDHQLAGKMYKKHFKENIIKAAIAFGETHPERVPTTPQKEFDYKEVRENFHLERRPGTPSHSPHPQVKIEYVQVDRIVKVPIEVRVEVVPQKVKEDLRAKTTALERANAEIAALKRQVEEMKSHQARMNPTTSGGRSASTPRVASGTRINNRSFPVMVLPAAAEPPIAPLAPITAQPSYTALLHDRIHKLSRLSSPRPRSSKSSRPLTLTPKGTGEVSEAEINQTIQESSSQDRAPDRHREAAHTIGEILKGNDELNVNEIKAGGSYAKGTSIGEFSDVDLIVVLNDLPEGNHQRWMHLLLAHLQSIVEIALPDCEILRITPHAVQVRLNGVDIDLLPVSASLWHSQDAVLNESTERTSQRWLSVLLARDQIEFGKAAPAGVVGVIRLMKRWVKRINWKSKKSKPSSYAIELIVIHAWKISDDASKQGLLLRSWNLIKNFDTMALKFDASPSRDIAQERPLIVDPANPGNNVVASFNYEEFKEHAIRIVTHNYPLRPFLSELCQEVQ